MYFDISGEISDECCLQTVAGNRFWQVIVKPCSKDFLIIAGKCICCFRNDLHTGPHLFYFNHCLVAIHNRHFQIHKYQVELGSSPANIYRFLPIFSRNNFNAKHFKHFFQDQEVILLIFNQQYGMFNYILNSLGIIPNFIAWIGDPQTALFSVILANIWKGFPFHMIVLLAALQTIPTDIVEAAVIDGATALQRFRYITLPYLRYIIMIDLLISIIWTFQSFTTIWTMTEGGPITATTTLAISIYRTAIQAFDMGMGAAIGTIWLVVMLIFSVVFVRVIGGTTKLEL